MPLTPAEKAELAALESRFARSKRMSALEQSKKNIAADAESYRATNGMSGLDKFGAGVASGVIGGIQGAGNMLGLVDDKTVQDRQAMEKDLGDTGMGMVGQMVGQGLLTAPVGGALGAGAKALQALPRAAGALRTGTKLLGSLPARGGVEGAVTAAMYSDPERRGEDAWMGAGVGGTLGTAGQVGKRLIKGLVKSSPDAGALEAMAAQHGKKVFIPVAQAADDEADMVSRGIKTIYKEGLPYVPGVSGQLKAQGGQLIKDIREIALREPDYLGVFPTDPKTGKLTRAAKDLLDNPQKAVESLDKAFAKEYSASVKRYDFSLPSTKDLYSAVTARVRKVIPTADDTTLNKTKGLLDEALDRYSNGYKNSRNMIDPNTGVISKLSRYIDGDSLLAAKNAINESATVLRGREKIAAQEAVKVIDDLIESTMKNSGIQGYADDLARYQAANSAWKDFSAVKRAVGKEKIAGKFTPAQLARSAGRSSTQRMIGSTAHAVTSNPVGIPGAAGRWFGRVGTVGAGMANLPLAAAGLAGSNLLATEAAQNAVMGKNAWQRFLLRKLKDNPAALRAGSGIRGAVVPEFGSNGGDQDAP